MDEKQNENGRHRLFEALSEQQKSLETMANLVAHSSKVIRAQGTLLGWLSEVAGVNNHMVAALKSADLDPQLILGPAGNSGFGQVSPSGPVTPVAPPGQVLLGFDADGHPVYQGVDVGESIRTSLLASLKTADTDNPAQPIPSEGTQAPAVTSEQAVTPDAKADLFSPGANLTDVAPAASTSVDSVGQDIGVELKAPQDVTKAVPGTDNVPGAAESHVDFDITSETGDNTSTAFPWTLPKASKRVFASLRLARLQIEAGTTEETNDLTLGEKIAHDQSMSDRDIERDIQTLESMKAAAKKQAAKGQQRQASRAPGGQRSMPSLQSAPGGFRAQASVGDDDAEFWMD